MANRVIFHKVLRKRAIVAIAICMLVLSNGVGVPHDHGHHGVPGSASGGPSLALDGHDTPPPLDHQICDLTFACSAKVLARMGTSPALLETLHLKTARIYDVSDPASWILPPVTPPPKITT